MTYTPCSSARSAKLPASARPDQSPGLWDARLARERPR